MITDFVQLKVKRRHLFLYYVKTDFFAVKITEL